MKSMKGKKERQLKSERDEEEENFFEKSTNIETREKETSRKSTYSAHKINGESKNKDKIKKSTSKRKGKKRQK